MLCLRQQGASQERLQTEAAAMGKKPGEPSAGSGGGTGQGRGGSPAAMM